MIMGVPRIVDPADPYKWREEWQGQFITEAEPALLQESYPVDNVIEYTYPQYVGKKTISVALKDENGKTQAVFKIREGQVLSQQEEKALKQKLASMYPENKTGEYDEIIQNDFFKITLGLGSVSGIPNSLEIITAKTDATLAKLKMGGDASDVDDPMNLF